MSIALGSAHFDWVRQTVLAADNAVISFFHERYGAGLSESSTVNGEGDKPFLVVPNGYGFQTSVLRGDPLDFVTLAYVAAKIAANEPVKVLSIGGGLGGEAARYVLAERYAKVAGVRHQQERRRRAQDVT